jgi:hypothetical protein
MTGRELLEAAAKAAGIDTARCLQYEDGAFDWPGKAGRWNPLTDDGDALRLAVRMAQMYGFFRFMRAWLVAMATEEGNPADPYAATRRAIVRAAAEIGRRMG